MRAGTCQLGRGIRNPPDFDVSQSRRDRLLNNFELTSLRGCWYQVAEATDYVHVLGFVYNIDRSETVVRFEVQNQTSSLVFFVGFAQGRADRV
ncbi:unnamed protein product [Fusarium venenatum]|uniref:Uncharacterized protein n=1 Tax=Fusarium venenatum TaxID=56646 RepID=A0A2L2TLQ3_9HYPO|nr:uncharacterized protein FVRRES_02993 [Fusarium venenatum]CEI66481.1 unnamed protein product [Fusarium venenatum]